MAKAANAASVSAETRRSAPRVQVVDLRRRTPTTAAAADGAEPPQAAAKDARTAESTATAAKPAPERAAPAEPKAVAAAPRATPLDRLREMTGADLVKTAGLVVRDGGGEIRLTLRPGSLGSVRIRLSLEDGKVEGRIVVDTPEARQAFEEGIPALARALQADGFETGALQVSVSGGRSGDQRQAAGLLDDTVAAARLRAIAAPAVEAAVVAAWTGDGLVNVYA
jgi:flagellar hook-length control protein FliK